MIGNKTGLIKRGVAVGLIALMACVNPMQTLSPVGGGAGSNDVPATESDALTGVPTTAKAAEKADPYVGAVTLAVDKDAATAKQILTDAGYEVIDQDLNEKAGSFWNNLGDQAVYMGIKRTADEKKAIRDMKTMNMLGKYSYSDLEDWVKNNRQSAKESIKPVLVALKEYRANVRNNDMIALPIKEMLDHVTEDDSGKTLGELFLDESCDETDLLKIIVEGNKEVVKAVLYELSMTLEKTEDTWLDRLSVTTKKSLTKEYAQELYGTDQVTGEQKATIEKLMKSEYDEDARKILDRWDEIRSAVAKSISTEEITDEDIKRILEVGFDQAYEEWVERSTVLLDNATVKGLEKIPYNGKTLLDLFKTPRESFARDITRLYPLVAALSPGQRAMLDYVRMDELMTYALMRRNLNEYDEAESILESIKKDINNLTEVSVYEGVDRAMFKDGAAMTSRATDAVKSGSDDLGDQYLNIAKWTGITTAILFGMTVFSLGLSSLALDEYLFFKNRVWTEKELKSQFHEIDVIENAEHLEQNGARFKVLTYAAAVLIVITVATAIAAISSYIAGQKLSHNRKQLPIPTVIVDKDVESDITGFMAYSAVLWNRDRQDDSGRGDRADLNGDAGDQWLALYTTTDKGAGDPILADTLTARTGLNNGETAPDESYSPLTMFGLNSVQNLVDEQYSYNNEVNGIWVWYRKADASATTELIDDTEEGAPEDASTEAEEETDQQEEGVDAASGAAADTTGSNISGGSVALIGTGCAVGGFVIGIICMYFVRRKKEIDIK